MIRTLATVVVSLTLFNSAPTAPAASSGDGPIGWASVNQLGQNGTTGGAGGTSVTVSNEAELKAACKSPGPCVINIVGTFRANVNLITSNKTLIGVGSDAGIIGGLRIDPNGDERKNIIIRNLTIRDAGGDAIAIQDGAHHIWIDHCNFTNCGDGTVDITHGCDYITVSWNRFYNHDKTLLLGHDDTDGAKDSGHLTVTYHHNWFDGTNQRHPRVRFSRLAHVFNNYYDGVSSYGVGSSVGAAVLVEHNYFRNVPTPFLSTSGVGESSPGYLKARDNVFDNCGATREQNEPQLVPEAGDFYDYRADAAADVREFVMNEAGVGKLSADPPTE